MHRSMCSGIQIYGAASRAQMPAHGLPRGAVHEIALHRRNGRHHMFALHLHAHPPGHHLAKQLQANQKTGRSRISSQDTLQMQGMISGVSPRPKSLSLNHQAQHVCRRHYPNSTPSSIAHVHPVLAASHHELHRLPQRGFRGTPHRLRPQASQCVLPPPFRHRWRKLAEQSVLPCDFIASWPSWRRRFWVHEQKKGANWERERTKAVRRQPPHIGCAQGGQQRRVLVVAGHDAHAGQLGLVHRCENH